jgi:hypothetical protein
MAEATSSPPAAFDKHIKRWDPRLRYMTALFAVCSAFGGIILWVASKAGDVAMKSDVRTHDLDFGAHPHLIDVDRDLARVNSQLKAENDALRRTAIELGAHSIYMQAYMAEKREAYRIRVADGAVRRYRALIMRNVTVEQAILEASTDLQVPRL